MMKARFVFVVLVAVLAVETNAFNKSVIDYDAIEINVPLSEIKITSGYLYVNKECTWREFSNWSINSYNRLNISRVVLSVVCGEHETSASGGLFPSLVLLLVLPLLSGLALSSRSLLLLVLVGAVLQVQAGFVQVETDQNIIVFNDFFELYNPKHSVAEMTFLNGNPEVNGSMMVLAYDPDFHKKYTFYFPIGGRTIDTATAWLVIKENLENQTIMYPSGKCVQTTSEFSPLEGYDYVPQHSVRPDGDCFVVYSGSLNAIILCAEKQLVVYFRNNEFALDHSRELTEADLPVTDEAFCAQEEPYVCSADSCDCCLKIAAAISGNMPVSNCLQLPGGGIARTICSVAATCASEACVQSCCDNAGYCF